MVKTLNYRTPGITPSIGGLLNSRYVYRLTDADGWEIKVHANDKDAATSYAAQYGFTAVRVHQIEEAA